MTGQVCHAHCPPEGGGALAGVVVVAGVIAAAVVARYLGDILWTVGIVLGVLLAASVWLLVHLLRRPFADVRAPAGRRLDAPLVAEYREGLPHGAQGHPVLVGKLTLAGQSGRDRAVIDQPAQDRRQLPIWRLRTSVADDHRNTVADQQVRRSTL